MKKITAMLNSPVKIAGFTACAVLLIGLIVFGTIQASAGINENKTIGMDRASMWHFRTQASKQKTCQT